MDIRSRIVPGHAEVEQRLVCWDEPEHFFPPFAGEGLVHVLDRVWEPPPHDLVHVDHLLQALHPPFTGRDTNNQYEDHSVSKYWLNI